MPEEIEFIHFLMLYAANYVYISSVILYCCAVPLDNNNKTVHGVAWALKETNISFLRTISIHNQVKRLRELI